MNPCGNIPVQCTHCPKGSGAVWNYNMEAHYSAKHSSVLPPTEMMITDFELEGLKALWDSRHTANHTETRCQKQHRPNFTISEAVTNGILHIPTTVLYARSVIKYVVRMTFRRARRRQTFSPCSGYFRIPLRNLAPFDSICFPFLFNMLNSGFIPFRYFSIRLYLQYHVVSGTIVS